MISSENVSMKILSKPFIYVPITHQPVKCAKNNFEILKDLDLAGSETMKEIIIGHL